MYVCIAVNENSLHQSILCQLIGVLFIYNVCGIIIMCVFVCVCVHVCVCVCTYVRVCIYKYENRLPFMVIFQFTEDGILGNIPRHCILHALTVIEAAIFKVRIITLVCYQVHFYYYCISRLMYVNVYIVVWCVFVCVYVIMYACI